MDSPDHTKPHILGIDPGLHGALALVRMVGGTPRVEVHDIPIHQVRINDGYRNRIDMDCAARWFVRHAPWIQCAIVEDVHAMPKDGPVGMGSACCMRCVRRMAFLCSLSPHTPGKRNTD